MYIVKLSLNDDTLFLLKIRKSIPEWTYEKEKARLFRSKQSANNVIGRIALITACTGTMEAVESSKEEKAVCTLDCFNCPFPDCRNGSAKRSEWEKEAMRLSKMED